MCSITADVPSIHTLRLERNGYNFEDGIFRHICLNGNHCIMIDISLWYIPIDKSSALVQAMAWPWWDDKPLLELVMPILLTNVLNKILKTEKKLWYCQNKRIPSYVWNIEMCHYKLPRASIILVLISHIMESIAIWLTTALWKQKGCPIWYFKT